MRTTPAAAPHGCPRCRGRLFTSHDVYGAYSSCLACGYVHEWVSGPAVTLPDDTAGGTRQRRREPSHGKQRL